MHVNSPEYGQSLIMKENGELRDKLGEAQRRITELEKERIKLRKWIADAAKLLSDLSKEREQKPVAEDFDIVSRMYSLFCEAEEEKIIVFNSSSPVASPAPRAPD